MDMNDQVLEGLKEIAIKAADAFNQHGIAGYEIGDMFVFGEKSSYIDINNEEHDSVNVMMEGYRGSRLLWQYLVVVISDSDIFGIKQCGSYEAILDTINKHDACGGV